MKSTVNTHVRASQVQKQWQDNTPSNRGASVHVQGRAIDVPNLQQDSERVGTAQKEMHAKGKHRHIVRASKHDSGRKT
jgi:hypothetical protein